jgi:hypothetical protein
MQPGERSEKLQRWIAHPRPGAQTSPVHLHPKAASQWWGPRGSETSGMGLAFFQVGFPLLATVAALTLSCAGKSRFQAISKALISYLTFQETDFCFASFTQGRVTLESWNLKTFQLGNVSWEGLTWALIPTYGSQESQGCVSYVLFWRLRAIYEHRIFET